MDVHDLSRSLVHSDYNRRLTWRARLRIIIFAMPVLFGLAAMGFAIEAGLYVLRSEVVEGTVVERYDRVGETVFDRGVINYEPIFAYDMNGESRRASVGSGHSSFDVAIGETALIRAIPGDTGNVRMNTWQGLWFIPVILAGMFAVTLVVSGLLWLLVRQVFRRERG